MPASIPRVYSNLVAAGGGLTGTTEGVIATSPAVSTQGAGAKVRLLFSGTIVPGSTQTSVTFKVERGTVAGGTQVGTSQVPVVASGNQIGFSVYVEDIPGDVDGQQYVLTGTQAGGAGNATTVNVGCLVLVD
jgi:hypothetical protein